MINKREAYTAMVAMLVAMANILFMLLQANSTIIRIFSFTMSLAVLYFSYRELATLDIIKNIRNMMLMNVMQGKVDEAWKEARDAVKNGKNPWPEQEI